MQYNPAAVSRMAFTNHGNYDFHMRWDDALSAENPRRTISTGKDHHGNNKKIMLTHWIYLTRQDVGLMVQLLHGLTISRHRHPGGSATPARLSAIIMSRWLKIPGTSGVLLILPFCTLPAKKMLHSAAAARNPISRHSARSMRIIPSPNHILEK